MSSRVPPPGLGQRQLFELTMEPATGSPNGRPTGPDPGGWQLSRSSAHAVWRAHSTDIARHTMLKSSSNCSIERALLAAHHVHQDHPPDDAHEHIEQHLGGRGG